MIKFYFNGAPNPNKVALFLEESGLPFEAIPVDTRICNPSALTVAAVAGEYPGRGLSAYRRALEWILAEDALCLEQAA